jgi:hypothetical protein
MAHVSLDILQRMLVVKHLLAAKRDQLTPNSDAVAVAQAILTSHDAAELAIAAIASHVKVPGLTERMSLPEYAPKIEAKTGNALSGSDYLKQLNAVRVNFKHHGVLPDARDWYRVIDKVWARVDEWCRTYLGVALDEIDLEQFLLDPDVKTLYEMAKTAFREKRYPDALEALGRGLYRQLSQFPGIAWPPAVGRKSTEDALMLAAFGVRPNDYLRLQDFLPLVSHDWPANEVVVEWNPRDKGHEGNWTEANVRFCLETFLDLSLKVQHAPPLPFPAPFDLVFDDVITPNGETAELFKWEYEDKRSATLLTGRRPSGRTVVRTLRPGERVRCRLMPAKALDKPVPTTTGGLGDLLELAKPDPTVDTAEVLRVHFVGPSGAPSGEPLYIDRSAVDISVEPKDDSLARQLCPHLYGPSTSA